MVFLPTDLIGVTFNTTKRPVFNTEIVTGDGGESRRNSIQVGRVRWYWKLNYEFVYKKPQGVDELFAFFASVAGPSTAFLYRDPTDNLVAQVNGTFVPAVSDGTSTTRYQIARIMSLTYPFVETVTNGPWTASFGSDTWTVYDNGVNYGGLSTVSVDSTGGVKFNVTTPPAAGHALTWAGNFYFPVHFKGDPKSGLSGDKFMNNYWAHTTVELESSLQ